MPSRAFGFVIEETTGSRRSITLNGRALPYRGGGVAWEGDQRTKLTWYPGNPQATQQILGPSELPTDLAGVWKERFLPGQVEISGFPGVSGASITPEQLIFAVDSIRVAGNQLRVQWGPFVRTGIMIRFRAAPDRIQDIPWEMEFEWSARNDAEAPRAAESPEGTPTIRQRLNDVDDELAFEPKTVKKDYDTEILVNLSGLRTQAGRLFDISRQVDGLALTPNQALPGISTATERIRVESEVLIGQLSDRPYTDAQTTDRVLDVLPLERWRRTLSFRVARFRSTAQARDRDAKKEARPGILKQVTINSQTTLRQLSLREYGTSDAWQTIADFNGISGSILPAGTVVIIPPSPVSAGGVQRANL